MRFWGLTLGGLLVWAAHFLGLYLLASFADVAWRDAAGGRTLGLAFSAVCLVVISGLVWRSAVQLRARPDDQTRAFALSLAAAGGVIAAVGVVFQTAPLLLA